jgi:hypothetical protein
LLPTALANGWIPSPPLPPTPGSWQFLTSAVVPLSNVSLPATTPVTIVTSELPGPASVSLFGKISATSGFTVIALIVYCWTSISDTPLEVMGVLFDADSSTSPFSLTASITQGSDVGLRSFVTRDTSPTSSFWTLEGIVGIHSIVLTSHSQDVSISSSFYFTQYITQ